MRGFTGRTLALGKTVAHPVRARGDSIRKVILSTKLSVAMLVLLSVTPSPASASDLAAAVVVIDDVAAAGTLDAAQDQVPGRWRLEAIKSEHAPSAPAQGDVDGLVRAYLNADFLRCLTELQRSSLDLERLLEHGRRREAAQVGTVAAACAMGAGDEVRAREMVRRLLVRELDDPDMLRRTTPQFQHLAEDERAVAQRWGRATVEVRTEPPGASVQVDGTMRCLVSPCRLHLLRGEHIVVTERLGRRSRSLTAMLDEDQSLTIALDPASADEIHRQLAVALGAGVDPSGADVSRAAATAFGVGLLALIWHRGAQVHACVFQRSGGGLTHVALDDTGPEPAARAVREALREWRAETGPRSMLRQPLFWTTAGAVALLSAAAVYLIVRPREPQHDLQF
jgi:hypothetical protein